MPGQSMVRPSVVERTGSWVGTVEDEHGNLEEIVLVACERADGPVRAWVNRCMHEDQRLHRAGVGAVIREGDLVCPRHGSMFDVCSGSCENGPAAGTSLIEVDVEIDEGTVVLTDERFTFEHEGPIDRGEGGPRSTSHLRF